MLLTVPFNDHLVSGPAKVVAARAGEFELLQLYVVLATLAVGTFVMEGKGQPGAFYGGQEQQCQQKPKRIGLSRRHCPATSM